MQEVAEVLGTDHGRGSEVKEPSTRMKTILARDRAEMVLIT